MRRSVLVHTGVIAGFMSIASIAEGADYHRLSMQWKGPTIALDVINGGGRNNFVELTQLRTLTAIGSAEAPAPPIQAASFRSTHVVQAMTFPGDGNVPPQSVFTRDTPKILLGLEVSHVKPGDTLTATWIAETTEAAPANFEIASVAIPIEASPTVSSSFSRPNAGWPPGQYRVDISYNGGPVEFSQRFSVKE